VGRYEGRLGHKKEKVCLKPLPGGFWERPCRKPPATTGATPPLLRHTRGARPRTAPPAHRQERRRDPSRPSEPCCTATRLPPGGTDRVSTPPSSEAPSADASAVSASAATGHSPTVTAATSVAAGAGIAGTSDGVWATSASATSPSTMAALAEEPASGTRSTATGAA
jgi:hypothetical protein